MARRALGFLLLLILTATTAAAAQQDTPAMIAEQRSAIIDTMAGALTHLYVFPDVAARMAEDLRMRAARGEFDTATDPASFARTLTERLQAVSHDKHLRVRAGTPDRPGGAATGGKPARRGIFGSAKRLEGNVAYVEILSFAFPPDEVREEVRDVMSETADADALILDVRANGGGSPETVALVCSYLFGEEPVLLNSLYFRPANRTDDFYTDPHVPGKKFGPDKPVYVLTSSRTFSGAEEFAYDLQTRERATIVGETTGGGANPGGPVPLPHGLTMFVPTGRAINPITKTNWEGVGVKPDIAVDARAALETAHQLARRAMSDSVQQGQ